MNKPQTMNSKNISNNKDTNDIQLNNCTNFPEERHTARGRATKGPGGSSLQQKTTLVIPS